MFIRILCFLLSNVMPVLVKLNNLVFARNPGKTQKGCGGSSVWEKPSDYQNPEISPVKYLEKPKNSDLKAD